VAGGYKAIDSLRLEKGYRVWGADITPEDTPFEAGLGFAVKLDKERLRRPCGARGFREPERRLRCLTLADPAAIALGSEPSGSATPRRARDERRLRLHGRIVDRVRLSSS
jgi:4-methylaminobutanoate oxidase (formaldehyde-forming)